jgi:hypothetical protein
MAVDGCGESATKESKQFLKIIDTASSLCKLQTTDTINQVNTRNSNNQLFYFFGEAFQIYCPFSVGAEQQAGPDERTRS